MTEDNYWQFRYRQGNATVTAHVEAATKVEAEEIARVWCSRTEGRVFCGILGLFSVADRSILAPLAVEQKAKVG